MAHLRFGKLWNTVGLRRSIPLLEDKVILVRQFRYAASTELLEIPAGTLEQGEDPEICASRELEEETGYRCNELDKILECFVAPGYSTERIHFYLARKLERSKMNTEEDEHIEVEMMPIARAIEKVRRGEIRDAKTVCGLYRALELSMSYRLLLLAFSLKNMGSFALRIPSSLFVKATRSMPEYSPSQIRFLRNSDLTLLPDGCRE